MIPAYLVHGEIGKLVMLDKTEAPATITVASDTPTMINPDMDAELQVEMVALKNSGYRWIGAVNRMAWLYQ